MNVGYKSILSIIMLLLMPLAVFALEQTYPTIDGTTLTDSSTLTDFVKYAFNFSVAASTVVAFFVIVSQGIVVYGNQEKWGEAKNKIINAGWGLALILASYIILITINPNLIVVKNITLLPLPEGNTEIPENPVTPPPVGSEAISFQEIPLGTLTENALAMKMNCLDKDKNLIDCTTKEIIDCYYSDASEMSNCKVEDISKAKVKDIYIYNASKYYCYTYDANGDKSSTNANWDRMGCLKNVLGAYEAKMQTLEDYVSQLSDLINKCSCSMCAQGSTYANFEECPGDCTGNCTCVTGTYKESVDPCGADNRIEIDKMKEKIKQLVNGGKRTDNYYDWHMNPYPDPNETDPVKKLEYNGRFMTLNLIMDKIADIKNMIAADNNSLTQGENILKADKGAITLSQLQNIEYYKNQSVSVSHFNSLKIDKYCYEFNGSLNSLGGACKIVDKEERYVMDGDPETFYYSSGFNIQTKYGGGTTGATPNQCVLSDTTGPIPIGQVIDKSKTAIDKIIEGLDYLMIRENTAIGVAYENANSNYNLPESCDCTNCTGGIHELRRQCCEDCLGELIFQKTHCVEAECTCNDKSPSERVCPFGEYTANQNSLKDINEDTADKIDEISAIIDSDRFGILSDLTNVRRKLESCVSGYHAVEKGDISRTKLISCQEGLLAVNTQGLIILPGFPWPETAGYYNCYPFNSPTLTNAQKTECYKNFTGEGGAANPKCQDFIKGLMDDYYCCK